MKQEEFKINLSPKVSMEIARIRVKEKLQFRGNDVESVLHFLLGIYHRQCIENGEDVKIIQEFRK